MTGRLQRLLSRTPVMRYIRSVDAGTAQKEEQVEQQEIVADIHTKRLNWLYYEQNHITPMVTNMIRGHNA